MSDSIEDFQAKVEGPPAEPKSVPVAATATTPADQPLPAAPPVCPVSIKKRIGLFLGLTAIGVLGALWLAEIPSHDHPGAVLTSSSFRVARIVRAAADAEPGLLQRASQAAAERPLAAGESVPGGVTLRTDGRTRAWLQSSAGVEVVMDHGTVLEMGGGGFELSLDEGEIVMEAGQAAQRLLVRGGWVEMEQGRASVTAAADSTSVRVLWGRAVVHGRNDTPIAAGQEALLARDGQIHTATALGLAGLNAWSETGADNEPEAEAEAPGLGELRARRPGDSRNREQPLRLAEHKVTVRILARWRAPRSTRLSRMTAPTHWKATTAFPCRPTRNWNGWRSRSTDNCRKDPLSNASAPRPSGAGFCTTRLRRRPSR